MPPTNDELLMFLRCVYQETDGRLQTPVSMWNVGETLDWEKQKTIAVQERLTSRGYVEPSALGGSIVLTKRGVDLCEQLLSIGPEREEIRMAVLRRIYEMADGSTRIIVPLFEAASDIGLDREQASDVFHHLTEGYFIEAKSIGGGVSLTTYGVDFVEQHLIGVELIEDAVRPSQAEYPPQMELPHTGERRYSFFSVDICDHSRLVKTSRRADAGRALNGFRKLVEAKVTAHFGQVPKWAGDGGIALFHGENSETRAAEAAMAVLNNMRSFNERQNKMEEPIEVRIAVHTGFFELPEDPGNLHDESINTVVELEGRTPQDCVCVTQDVYKELPADLKSAFHESGERAEGVRTWDYSGKGV